MLSVKVETYTEGDKRHCSDVLYREDIKRGNLENDKQNINTCYKQKNRGIDVCVERERPIISACSCMNRWFLARPPQASIVSICIKTKKETDIHQSLQGIGINIIQQSAC